jgi:isoleucyl-tRNA synthetase
MAEELKDTLNLPVTDFPMRAGLAEREPVRLAHWERNGLYGQIQARAAGKPAFVLHDGPPFTNGDVHIGTALNKLLKDSILRYKSMRGFRTPYVPGWDCHGLPIEHKVMKELQAKKQSLDALGVRKACAEFSAAYIEKQRGQFKRLGILADWQSEYRTMDPAYEAEILKGFACFVEKGLVYRSKKPVYWSIPCQTALAEAEIEYKDKRSYSVWVAFPVADPAAKQLAPAHPLSVVIWTTTPWTLPANLAIAVHPELEYVEVRHGERSFLVASALREAFVAACALEGATDGFKVKGRALEGLQPQHPFIDRASPVVLADYVTTDAGTGCVHTAPGHGLEDYQTGNKYGMEPYCPVRDDGTYADDGKVPASLVGITVLETDGKNPANIAVLELLKSKGALLKAQSFEHSYPHCWRSKTPVVFRALDQWFVGLDRGDLRKQALAAVGDVKWIPASGENRIRAALEGRPDWCISRQRAWGVPIPAFYSPSKGESYLDGAVVRHVAQQIATRGGDWWWAASVEEILAGAPVPAAWPKDLRKGTDTLDVWIDSGSSHLAVCAKHKDLHWPADLYLEATDQHRGWFQSSLMLSVAYRQAAPYKAVLTHGFVVDKDKKKLSKSEAEKAGKPIDAAHYYNKYGADIVRLWVSSVDWQSEVPFGEELFKQVAEPYRRLRNTLRILLGNLDGFDPGRDAIAAEDLPLFDRWILERLHEVVGECRKAYETYEFRKVFNSLNQFCTADLSAVYIDVTKDRMYCDAADSLRRRATQTAMYELFSAVEKHTTAWAHRGSQGH